MHLITQIDGRDANWRVCHHLILQIIHRLMVSFRKGTLSDHFQKGLQFTFQIYTLQAIQIGDSLMNTPSIRPSRIFRKEQLNHSQLTILHSNMAAQVTQQLKVSTNIGRIYSESNEIAIDCYLKLIKHNPCKSHNYIKLAVLFQNSHRMEEAIQLYQRALVIDPKNSTIYQRLGNAYSQTNKIYNATDCYYKAINYNPKYFGCYQKLAAIFKTTDPKQSSRCSGEVTRIVMQGIWLFWLSFHQVPAKNRRVDEEFDRYKVIEKCLKDLDVLYCLGVSLYDMEKIQQSIACFNEAEKLVWQIAKTIKGFNLTLEEVVNLKESQVDKFKALWQNKDKKYSSVKIIKQELQFLFFD